MGRVTGRLVDVSDNPALVREVWVKSPRERLHADGLVTTDIAHVEVRGDGRLSFEVVDGPAVLVMVHQGANSCGEFGFETAVPLVVAGDVSLAAAVAAGGAVVDENRAFLERLAGEVVAGAIASAADREAAAKSAVAAKESAAVAAEKAGAASSGAAAAAGSAGKAEAAAGEAAGSAAAAKSSAGVASAMASEAAGSASAAGKSARHADEVRAELEAGVPDVLENMRASADAIGGVIESTEQKMQTYVSTAAGSAAEAKRAAEQVDSTVRTGVPDGAVTWQKLAEDVQTGRFIPRSGVPDSEHPGGGSDGKLVRRGFGGQLYAAQSTEPDGVVVNSQLKDKADVSALEAKADKAALEAKANKSELPKIATGSTAGLVKSSPAGPSGAVSVSSDGTMTVAASSTGQDGWLMKYTYGGRVEVGDPTSGWHATNKKYVDAQVAAAKASSGESRSGTLSNGLKVRRRGDVCMISGTATRSTSSTLPWWAFPAENIVCLTVSGNTVRPAAVNTSGSMAMVLSSYEATVTYLAQS